VEPTYPNGLQTQDMHSNPNDNRHSSIPTKPTELYNLERLHLLLQLAFTEGTNNKLHHPLGNWHQRRISQAWNQVFSPEEHKIYSLEMEPT
jgi:hypothetical protein